MKKRKATKWKIYRKESTQKLKEKIRKSRMKVSRWIINNLESKDDLIKKESEEETEKFKLPKI